MPAALAEAGAAASAPLPSRAASSSLSATPTALMDQSPKLGPGRPRHQVSPTRGRCRQNTTLHAHHCASLHHTADSTYAEAQSEPTSTYPRGLSGEAAAATPRSSAHLIRPAEAHRIEAPCMAAIHLLTCGMPKASTRCPWVADPAVGHRPALGRQLRRPRGSTSPTSLHTEVWSP